MGVWNFLEFIINNTRDGQYLLKFVPYYVYHDVVVLATRSQGV